MLLRRARVLLQRGFGSKAVEERARGPILTIGDVLNEREEAKLNSENGKIANFETWERIDAKESVREAVDRMVKNEVGSLIVTETGRGVVGIVTERDILNRVTPNAPLAEDLLVHTIMSTSIMCIHSSTHVME